ncbi:MAG: S-layer homology domain-containing protein [Thermoanaerobaculia bacterium]
MRRKWFIAVAGLVGIQTLVALGADGPGGRRPAAPSAPGGPDANLPSVPSVFGTSGIDIYTVGWADLLPASSAVGYASNEGAVSGGYRWTTSNSAFLSTGLEGIPNGAIITQIVWYVNDANAASDFTGYLVRYWRESNFGGSPGGDILSTLSTTGTPGDTITFEGLSHTVLRRADVTGDTLPDVINYVLFAETPPFDGTVAFGETRILWQRQVSPAPAVATFPDVPTSDGAFQFVEALVASGITAGCGGGNYCPDAPLTRRQMAVFLAKALGLHWPAF